MSSNLDAYYEIEGLEMNETLCISPNLGSWDDLREPDIYAIYLSTYPADGLTDGDASIGLSVQNARDLVKVLNELIAYAGD